MSIKNERNDEDACANCKIRMSLRRCPCLLPCGHAICKQCMDFGIESGPSPEEGMVRCGKCCKNQLFNHKVMYNHMATIKKLLLRQDQAHEKNLSSFIAEQHLRRGVEY